MQACCSLVGPRLLQPSAVLCHRSHWGTSWRWQQRRAAVHATPTQQDAGEAAQSPLSTSLLVKQTIATFVSGAALGPLLDGMHSKSDVLHYKDPFVLQLGSWQLETCWWVPPLFGLAGIIIGVSVPLLDRFIFKDQGTPTSGAAVAAGPSSLQAASWPAVLLCISLFVSQYGLSGFLERQLTASLADQSLLGLPASDVALSAILWAYAAAHLTAFDRSKSVLLMAALTAVCGPLIECALINGPGLYTYTHPTMAGIPLWIAPVYFAGGPAVGGLGKRVWEDLSAQEERAKHR